MTKSAEHASPLPLSIVCKFVCVHALADRPHTSLWLAKTYVIAAKLVHTRRALFTTIINSHQGPSLQPS